MTMERELGGNQGPSCYQICSTGGRLDSVLTVSPSFTILALSPTLCQ